MWTYLWPSLQGLFSFHCSCFFLFLFSISLLYNALFIYFSNSHSLLIIHVISLNTKNNLSNSVPWNVEQLQKHNITMFYSAATCFLFLSTLFFLPKTHTNLWNFITKIIFLHTVLLYIGEGCEILIFFSYFESSKSCFYFFIFLILLYFPFGTKQQHIKDGIVKIVGGELCTDIFTFDSLLFFFLYTVFYIYLLYFCLLSQKGEKHVCPNRDKWQAPLEGKGRD